MTLLISHAVVPRGEAVALVEGDHVVVWLHGDIDLTMDDDLRGLVGDLDEFQLPVILDGSHVTFFDSTGLRFVLQLMECGLPVTLRKPSAAVRLLLDTVAAAAPVAESTDLP